MKTGILTFYCSDNSGAMLQACGLKYYVQSVCPETEIIPYAPAYLTGRHWLLPYCPFDSPAKSLRWAAAGLKRNLKAGRAFFRRRRNMKSFRQTYLVRKRKKIRTRPYIRCSTAWRSAWICGDRAAPCWARTISARR